MKDFELAKELVEYLEENLNLLDITDLANIKDFYMFKTLELIKKKDLDTSVKFINLFEELYKKVNADFNKGFFFTLAQILSLKEEYGWLEGNLIRKEEWKKSFEITLKKLGLK